MMMMSLGVTLVVSSFDSLVLSLSKHELAQDRLSNHELARPSTGSGRAV